ncbi:UPF0271 protein [Tamaricihabitans halophyticus]|uniref:5-oxoprolinase subunit A n=1 Tax=Tamaricihabitans halophyticus TaxID=1262583 RepID=A0A4R2QT76_9PSEU|nr:5-oxoprolinase subunit PxpA [Tamaricihabitans halophyticus]TCP53132.1 UPF0271 protein [Tamaricihabitans halophyticus]
MDDTVRNTPTIDLNSDLGEGFGIWELGDDQAMLGIVTSANVACGFHAGDPSVMRGVCARAASRGVAIGAQVSYRDLAGFGRRYIDVDPTTLADEVLYQIAALDGFARVAGSAVRYVKPHGALYHACARDTRQAQAVVTAVREYGGALPVLGLPDSELLRAAERAGLPAVPEAFADRGYTPDGALVPRAEPGAVLTDVDEIARRCVGMALHGTVPAVDGSTIRCPARSICVHGDTPNAVAIAARVHRELTEAGVPVRPFIDD